VIGVILAAATVLLTASALLALVRLAIGPSSLDRGVAAEVIVSVLAASVGAHAVWTRTPVGLGILLVLSLVGFTGSVALARLVRVSRQRDLRYRREHPTARGRQDGPGPGERP